MLQVEEEEAGDEKGGSPGGGSRFPRGSSGSDAVGLIGREMPPRKLKKRARAWKIFLAVMQDHGLRVRKYHRHGKGWAHRVVKYDPALPGLRWKTSKWWDSSGGQVRTFLFYLLCPCSIFLSEFVLFLFIPLFTISPAIAHHFAVDRLFGGGGGGGWASQRSWATRSNILTIDVNYVTYTTYPLS